MKNKTNTTSRLLTASAAVLCAFTVRAHAAVIITLQQQGSNVVANGSGTINTSALTGIQLAYINSGICASDGPGTYMDMMVGPSTVALVMEWNGFTGPSNFGAGVSLYHATSGSGDMVGIFDGVLFFPAGYVSGASLSDSATWANQTFGSLGVTPGTYTWTWGSGPTADSLTLNATATPEPASAVLLLGGGALLGLRRRRPSAGV